MWFKNLRVYRLTDGFDLSAETLSERLDIKAFSPCARSSLFSFGWASPMGKLSEMLVHASNGNFLLCAKREEKIMPASVVREMVQEKAEMIEKSQARKVRKRERDSLRDEIIQDLLPRALCRSAQTYAYISPAQNLLIIDAASAKTAEAFLSLLRVTLGSLPVQPLAVKERPAGTMTSWLMSRAAPTGLVLEDECVLRDPMEEGGVVRCRRLDLEGDEIRTHLDSGKQVVRLALCWNESFSFLLDDDLAIKRLRFTDVVREHAADMSDEDEASRFDADFSIMILELSRFLPALLSAFGGEDDDAYQSVANQAA